MDATIDAIEIGTVLSGVLFGLITSQTYVYFKTFPKDSRFSKVGVGALWIVELAHTACIFNALYIYTVTEYGDPSSLKRFPMSLGVSLALHGAAVIIGMYHHMPLFIRDVVNSTLALIDKLIMWSVETCLVTTISVVMKGTDFAAVPRHGVEKLVGHIKCGINGILKLDRSVFSNALLANLNSRSGLRDAASSDVHDITINILGTDRLLYSRFSPAGVTMSKESEKFNDKVLRSPAQDSSQTTDSPVEEKFAGPT
ncbi:hypothetical protein C8R45DRAFT_940946 [Mycena sanguinolenta]|nr:hypothetical protein C8R45DRAFT_940946 [Mycena sanguinolenta]